MDSEMGMDFTIIQGNSKFVFRYTARNEKSYHEATANIFLTDYKYKFLLDCECGRCLCIGYIYILQKLIEAQLLPEDYKAMCCYCNLLACIGFYIPKEWNTVNVSYFFTTKFNGINSIVVCLSGYCNRKFFELDVSIYDIDKALNTGRILNGVNLH